jgi:hypothetical protein
MKLSPLSFIEVIHQFSNQCELFERRGEDGILAKVDFIFVYLQAFMSLKESK